MSDFILVAPDQATMYAGYAAVGIMDGEGNIRTQGLLPDGTEWCALDHGPRAVEGDTNYYCVLRWNGGAPTPPVPPGVGIFWSSASGESYPEGITQIA